MPVILATWATLVATLPLASATPPSELVLAGHHDIATNATDIIVESTWVLDKLPEPDALFVLAAALPRETAFEGARAVYGDDGDVVALRMTEPSVRYRIRTTLSWTVVRSEDVLPLPVAKGRAVHRIALDPDVSYRPDPALGLVTELGFTAPEGFGFRERRATDRLILVDAPSVGVYYVEAPGVARAGGVRGAVERRVEAHRRVALVAGVVFVVLCGAAAWEYRRARRRAEIERAEAIIEAEYAGLEYKDDE